MGCVLCTHLMRPCRHKGLFSSHFRGKTQWNYIFQVGFSGAGSFIIVHSDVFIQMSSWTELIKLPPFHLGVTTLLFIIQILFFLLSLKGEAKLSWSTKLKEDMKGFWRYFCAFLNKPLIVSIASLNVSEGLFSWRILKWGLENLISQVKNKCIFYRVSDFIPRKLVKALHFREIDLKITVSCFDISKGSCLLHWQSVILFCYWLDASNFHST